ncbi:DUF1697 domain-containing protein [Paenibacillus sp. YN15]|uniref:DUF1697 domain-containing protein n=1 Tax=Paenibacillus sp. YN15 TaxID=1742774 RepID=UPI000DCE5FFB|nr:DUF1697 domain-containing protein [Paenibacillus sp. YN15]RAU97933.1 DUF1697 domain-containing protein [Paenibacillus sp. YN15]
MIYVALLRGINVGGNNKVDMKRLKAAFEQAGMRQVVTYINSGNIVFSWDAEEAASGRSLSGEQEQELKRKLAGILEEAILREFNLPIRVVIRSLKDIREVIRHLPEAWTNDDTMRSDVLFLWAEADAPEVLDELKFKPEIDRVLYAPGAVLWSVDRANATRSGMQKLIGTKLYGLMTVRNVNTTRKIHQLMEEAAAVAEAEGG